MKKKWSTHICNIKIRIFFSIIISLFWNKNNMSADEMVDKFFGSLKKKIIYIEILK